MTRDDLIAKLQAMPENKEVVLYIETYENYFPISDVEDDGEDGDIVLTIFDDNEN